MKRSPKTVSSLAGGITIGVLIALMAGGAGAKAEKANRIHKVNVNEKGGATTIIVEGSKRVNYTAFRLSSPKRLVVDVANSHVRGIPSLLQKSTALIDGIAVSEYSVNGAPVSRIMINFKKDAAYRVRPRGDTLVITLNGPPKGKKGSTKVAQVSTPERTESDKALKQREQKARHELEQAKKLQEKARKEAAQARRLQEEARASQKEARELKQKAKEDIASAKAAKVKASSEAKKAKSRLKNANSVAKKARSEQNNINGELARLQSERDSLQAKAQKALSKAKAAQKRLSAIKNELNSETKKNLLAKAEIDKASKELEKYRQEAKSAKALVAREQTSRKKLEKDVSRLNKSLKHARLEKSQAEKAHDAALTKVAELDKQFDTKEKAHARAEDNAKHALTARKAALDAYKRAAEDEKDQLKAVLAKRENESREAAAKLYRLENDHRKARSALAKAKDNAKRAQENAKDASVTEQELKIRAKKKIARMDKQRALARQAALEAEQKAKKAASAKKAAEKKLAGLQKEYDKKLRQVEKQAKLELATAESRLRKLDREKNKNAKQLTKLENQLLTAQKETDQAERRAKAEAHKAREVQEKLSLANKKIADQEDRIERLAQKAKKKNAKIPKYEKQLAAADKKINQAGEKISKQQSKIEKLKRQLARSQAAEKKAKKQELAARKQQAVAEKQQAVAEKQQAVAERKRAAAEKQRASAEKARPLAKKKAPPKAPLGKAVEKDNSRLIELQLAALRKKGRSLSKLERRRLKRLEQMQAKTAKKTPAKPKTQLAKKEAAIQSPMITDISFEADGGRQKMLIHSNKPLDYTTADDAMGNSTMQLKNVALAPVLERTLDVEEFGGIVDKIHSYHADGLTQIEVDVTAFASNSLSRSGNVIEWTFVPEESPAKKTRRAPKNQDRRLASKTIHKEDSSAYAYPYERTAGATIVAAKHSSSRYTGRRIDLDFKDADIHNILRLLSDVGQVNIITSDEVKGTVTIRMRDVAWDHALDVILKTKSLGMVRRGNLIRVALLETLESEREMEIARRKQRVALEPLETRLIPVSYAMAQELVPRAGVMLSERGVLQVDERTNVIIARDTVENLEQIEALVRSLDTQTPQVLIEGRIVEATSTYAREIGIQWGGDFSASQATGNPTGLAFPSTVGVAGGATDQQTPVFGMSPVAGARPNPNFAVNMPAATGTGSGGALGISLGSIANNANLNLRLSAMEESGTLKILSSPKILTLDNREAYIEQGTLIPYSQVSAQGVQTAFKEAKLNLTVTPHVTADGSVMLSLKLMRDEPDFNNTGAQGNTTILKREAETELLVDDGHTAVIGGIFTRNHGMGFKKVPFFADIPIIGWLFKSKSVSDRRSEMLIFITPRIVNRAESIGQ